MLSISARGDPLTAIKYYEHLETDPAHTKLEDYYAQDSSGYFAGTGADRLSLTGSVRRKDFEELAAGRTPVGEVQGAGAEHRSGWDLTFSAPKPVSVLWGTVEPEIRERIAVAHDRAILCALEFMERHAGYARRGTGGKTHEHIGLVAAIYRHGTSRELDPQLHSHAFVFNVAPRADGSLGAIESRYLYEWKMAGGAAYRAELSSELQKLGYTIERDGKSFKVAGVPDELCSKFSKRRKQIERALSEHGATSARASEVAALSTRRVKSKVDHETLIKAWQQAAQEICPDWTPEQCLNQLAKEFVPLDIKATQVAMTQQNSTISEAQMYAVIGVERQVHGNIAAIEKSVSEVKRDRETVTLTGHHHEARFSTKEMQRLEATMVERAVRMSKTKCHIVSSAKVQAAIDARLTLSNEQIAAIEHVTKGNDLSVVQGDAGTGKSFMLSAAKDAWVAEGYRVRGASLSGKAAQELQQSSGIESTTLKKLEMDLQGYLDLQRQFHPHTDKLTAKDIVVVDESGMSGSRQIAALLQNAEQTGAKVVLIGDSRQLQAIDAGSAFRAVAERTGYESLVDIRRQHMQEDRQAVRNLRDGRADEALQNLDKRGRVHEHETQRLAKEETGRSVAEDLAAGKRSLGLAGTRQDAHDINEYARVAAREKDLVVGQDVVVGTPNGERQFAVGDRMLFCRNNRALNVKNGDLCTVKSICERDGSVHMTVQLDRGGNREVDTHKYDHLDHGYCITVHKAQGSTVDRAHVLASDNGTSSREWSYVAVSRAKEETHIHGDKYTLQELAPAWSKAHQKDVSLDYQLAEKQAHEKARDKQPEAHDLEPYFEYTINN